MSSFSAIGGYFELETRMEGAPYYTDALELNSARNAFEYVLRTKKPKRVYMPKFTCDVMLEPLQKTKTEYRFYELNDQLEIASEPTLGKDELLLYTNYFGIKDAYATVLARRLRDQLVVDCSQAFYCARASEEHVLYSPRKFVGVADGAYLITDKKLAGELPTDTSYQRMSHLLKRADLGAEAGYEDFKENDDALIGAPIKHMSRLTKKILASLDYQAIKKRRLDNFRVLHEVLKDKNELSVAMTFAVPMVYPFKTNRATELKQKLIARKIFVPTYWPNVFEWCQEGEVEYQLARDIIPLPVDQRYTEKDMRRILEVLL